MRDLARRVAIITGASSGVGWQAALELAREGARVALAARRERPLVDLARRIERVGGAALPVPTDVSDEAAAARLVERTVARFGRVDLLVNAAAVQIYGPFESCTVAEVARVLDVDFLGAVRCARAVLPVFRRQGSGHLLLLASLLALGAAPLVSAYVAAERALLGWADALRLELSGSGIDLSVILLPSLSTPFVDHAGTHLGRAPQPIWPIWDTVRAARAVVACARRPRARLVAYPPGRLWPWLARAAPSVAGTFGASLQLTARPAARRPEGNLFRPVPEGAGPYGSAPPTPAWKIAAAAAGLALGVAAVGLGARDLARAARRIGRRR